MVSVYTERTAVFTYMTQQGPIRIDSAICLICIELPKQNIQFTFIIVSYRVVLGPAPTGGTVQLAIFRRLKVLLNMVAL